MCALDNFYTKNFFEIIFLLNLTNPQSYLNRLIIDILIVLCYIDKYRFCRKKKQ